MKLKILLVSVSCAVTLTGCSTTEKSSETQAVLSTLKSHGYTEVRYGKMLDRSPSQQSWVALCKDAHGNEYIVVLDSSGKLVRSVQLGIDGRLTYEQMKKLLEIQGIKPSDLGPYLSKENILYWKLQKHLYYLSGVQYQ